MSEKLMTVRELSDYLGISEEKIVALVEKRVLSAYKIGGELLRFRKEQIDAIRPEIESRVKNGLTTGSAPDADTTGREHHVPHVPVEEDDIRSRIADFFYFNDFYIVSAVLVVILLFIIFRG
ncbi:MAG: helix-turn-helix domain-containing protein [Candidatus Omnitrophica bacterium]|nr:helix-turn-helix domain-containing protein [Candidatus Omnitrophota bacterium]